MTGFHTWLPSLADTSAMLLRRAWCWVSAARVAPPATPTIDCKAQLALDQAWFCFWVKKFAVFLLTLHNPDTQTITVKYSWKAGAKISRNIAKSFKTSAKSLKISNNDEDIILIGLSCRTICYLQRLQSQSRETLKNQTCGKRRPIYVKKKKFRWLIRWNYAVIVVEQSDEKSNALLLQFE